MSEHETVADIIAEKRREANYIVQVAQGKCHTRRDKAEDEARDIRREADRLDAAHKRERGDCAKLREAIVHMIDTADSIAIREPTGVIGKLAFHIKHTGDAALAAPPRNCDKYANHNDAMKAFDAFVREQGKLGFINPYTEAFKWLFTTATEQEGGNDADE